MPKLPELNPEESEFDRVLSLNQLPKMDDLKLMDERELADDSEEMVKEMWAEFEGKAEEMRLLSRDYAPAHWDLDEEYN